MGGPISAKWHCLQIDAVTDTVVPFGGTAEAVPVMDSQSDRLASVSS